MCSFASGFFYSCSSLLEVTDGMYSAWASISNLCILPCDPRLRLTWPSLPIPADAHYRRQRMRMRFSTPLTPTP